MPRQLLYAPVQDLEPLSSRSCPTARRFALLTAEASLRMPACPTAYHHARVEGGTISLEELPFPTLLTTTRTAPQATKLHSCLRQHHLTGEVKAMYEQKSAHPRAQKALGIRGGSASCTARLNSCLESRSWRPDHSNNPVSVGRCLVPLALLRPNEDLAGLHP